MKYIIYLILLLFISCKSINKRELLFIDTSKLSQNKIEKEYYKYDFKGNREFKKTTKDTTFVFYPIIYTNVSESYYNPKIPKSILSISNNVPKDIQYFLDKLDGKYVFYVEKDKKIFMREYGNYFDYNKLRDIDSLKWLTTKITTEQQVYTYLKKNNIKYKLINKHSDGYTLRMKIQLEPSGYYTYISVNGNWLISNTYYQAKDTLYLYNNFGRHIFR